MTLKYAIKCLNTGTNVSLNADISDLVISLQYIYNQYRKYIAARCCNLLISV